MLLFVPFLLCAAAGAQLLPEERKGLSDALFINNLTFKDLEFQRRTVNEAYPLDLLHLCVDKPLDGIDQVMRFHSEALKDMPSKLIRLARTEILGDQAEYREPLALEPATVPTDVPAEIRSIVDDYCKAVNEANAYVYRALKGLTPDEKRALVDSLPRLAASDETVGFGFLKTKPVDLGTALQLLEKVNLPLMRRAAEALANAVELDLSALLGAARGSTWSGSVKFRYGGITAVVSGVGDDLHDEKGVQLVIDLGGRNRYTWREGAGVLGASLLVDCGNSSFDQQDLGAGSGLLGVGVAYTFGADDTFTAGSIAFGAGLAGVGVLYKGPGQASFSSKALSEGFGEFGIGALIDESGSDRFDAAEMAQGAGRTQGVGWLVAREGDESLRLTASESRGQGCGLGYPGLGGGMGLVTHGAGTDTYSGRRLCQGAADLYSAGSVYEGSGKCSFIATSRAQAFASGQSCGSLLELSGSGSHVLSSGEGQGLGRSGSVAMFLNRSGDPVCVGSDNSPGAGIDKGLGIFFHGSGAARIVSADVLTGTGGLGVFVDLGLGVASANVRSGESVSYRAGGIPKPAVAGQEAARPLPAARTLPSDAEIEKLFARATDPSLAVTDRNEARDEIVACGMPCFNWILTNKLVANSSLSPEARALVGDLARILGTPARNALAIKINDRDDALALAALTICTEGRVPEAAPLILGTLSRPALAKEGARAAGVFDVKDAASTLMVLAGQPDKALELEAVRSMAALADPATLTTGQALLGSNDLLIRQAALELVAELPGGFEVAKSLLKDPDESTERTGIRILGRIGSEAALDLVGQCLTDAKSGVRIEALVALSARVPEKYRATVAALKGDPSELVRAVLASGQY